MAASLSEPPVRNAPRLSVNLSVVVALLLSAPPGLAQTGAGEPPADTARPEGARPTGRPEGQTRKVPTRADDAKGKPDPRKTKKKTEDPATTRPADTTKAAPGKPSAPAARVTTGQTATGPDETRPTPARKPKARPAARPGKPAKPGKASKPAKPKKSKFWWWSVSAGGGWYAPFPKGKTDTRPSDIPLSRLGFGYVRLGVRWKWLEPEVQWEIASVRDYPYDMLDVTVDVGVSAYSYQHHRFRFRHGLRIGYRFTANARCYAKRTYPDPDPCEEPRSDHTFNFLQLRAHLADVSVRLYSGLWLEVSPVTIGWPYFYFASLGLRWEDRI